MLFREHSGMYPKLVTAWPAGLNGIKVCCLKYVTSDRQLSQTIQNHDFKCICISVLSKITPDVWALGRRGHFPAALAASSCHRVCDGEWMSVLWGPALSTAHLMLQTTVHHFSKANELKHVDEYVCLCFVFYWIAVFSCCFGWQAIKNWGVNSNGHYYLLYLYLLYEIPCGTGQAASCISVSNM